MLKKYFCETCRKKIKKGEIPWCDSCKIIRYNKAKRSQKLKRKNNMFTNQETTTDPETPETSTDTPETEESTEEKTEEKTE